MRVPFFEKEIRITEERYNFIKNSRGGSSGIFAGAIFWATAVWVSFLTSKEIASFFYIFGGMIIPIVSPTILKAMGGRMEKSPYNSLVILSNMLFLFMYPLIVIVGAYNINFIPSAIAIINGAHLLVFMWIHYEFYHLIMAVLSVGIGCLFIFVIPEYAYYGVGSIGFIMNLIFGYLIYKATVDPLKGYDYRLVKVH